MAEFPSIDTLTQQELMVLLARVDSQINQARSELSRLSNTLQNVLENLNTLRAQLQQISPGDARLDVVQSNIEIQNNRNRVANDSVAYWQGELTRLQQFEQQIRSELARRQSITGTVSTGELSQTAAEARDPAANTQIPEQPPAEINDRGQINPIPTVTVATNALPATSGNDVSAVGAAIPVAAAVQGRGGVPNIVAPPAPPTLPTGASPSTLATEGTIPTTAQGQGSSQPVSSLQTAGITQPTQSYVYKATVVTSTFSRGRFTQEIEGVLIVYPDGINVASFDTLEQYGRTPEQTANAQATAAAGTMRPNPGTPAGTNSNAGAAGPTVTNEQTSVFTSGTPQPATSGGQQVGVFDYATVGQGQVTPTNTNNTSNATVGFDFSTVAQTNTRTNQQIARET